MVARALPVACCLTNGGCLAAARARLARRRRRRDRERLPPLARRSRRGLLHVQRPRRRARGDARRRARSAPPPCSTWTCTTATAPRSLAATRPWLFDLSIYGNDYGGNTAYRDVTERRHEDGANHRSFALPAGCDRDEHAARRWTRALAARSPRGRPDVLLYQAGADPYREDPYSPLELDHDDLRARDRRVFEFAQRARACRSRGCSPAATPRTLRRSCAST